MKKLLPLTMIMALALALLLAPAYADIIGVSGNATDGGSAAGLDLSADQTDSNKVVGFDELQCVSLSSGTLSVDYLISASDVGTTFLGVQFPQAGSPTIAAGTYSSHILHFSPVDQKTVLNGTFNFDRPIVALIANRTFLNDIDSILGNAANYPKGLGRRWEGGADPNRDFVTIDSLTQLTVDKAQVGGVGGIDQLRVVTQCGLTVEIDIRPGSAANPINPNSNGVVPVAILGSNDFDVNDVDRSTLEFGPGGATPSHKALGHLEDVNNDGFMDLVSHYKIKDAGIAQGDIGACVTGETNGNIPFEGCDSIRTVGK